MASALRTISARTPWVSKNSPNFWLKTIHSRPMSNFWTCKGVTTGLRAKTWQRAQFQFKAVAFHTSSKRHILPAEPQVIQGTVNDPAPTPDPYPTHGSYHWVFERAISAALIPVTIAPFAAGTEWPLLDAVLCATILIHSHIGFQSIIIDYIPMKRLPRARKVFWWGLRAATLTVAVGLYEFETNDVGLTEGIKRIWRA